MKSEKRKIRLSECRRQTCFHYAEREDFGDSIAGSTIRLSESNVKICFHYAEHEDFGGNGVGSTMKN